ncbi:TadE-like protein [compost metagenome]
MNKKRVGGVYVVEFAIIGLLLFIMLFGMLEMGRLLFTVNALTESVRRGARLASVCYVMHSDVRRRPVFAEVSESLSPLINNLDYDDVVVRYLDANGVVVALPTGAGYSLIRFVEVSITGFQMNLLIPVVGGPITLQTFRSVLPRESLGRYPQGTEITPC